LPSAISHFNLLDIGLVLLGIVALYIGYHRGFVRQVLQLTALIGGIALATRFHGPLARAEWMRPVADAIGVDGAEIVAFAGVLLAVFAACHILVCGFYGTAKGNAIGGLDRLFGGAFGIAKVLLLSGILMLAVLKGSPGDSIARLVEESVLGSRIVRGARELVRAIPEAAMAPVREFFTGGAAAARTPSAERGAPPREPIDARRGRDHAVRKTDPPAADAHAAPPRPPASPPSRGSAPGPQRLRGAPPIRIAPTPDADGPAPRKGIF